MLANKMQLQHALPSHAPVVRDAALEPPSGRGRKTTLSVPGSSESSWVALSSSSLTLTSVCAPSLPGSQMPRAPSALVCKAVHKQQQQQPEEERRGNPAGLPFATILAGALLTGALVPEDALAARSGGRVGGSGGFRASRAAPRAAPQQ